MVISLKKWMALIFAAALLAACGSTSASVDDDPQTEEGDVEATAGADATEGEAGVDLDVGDDDDPEDTGETGEYDEGSEEEEGY